MYILVILGMMLASLLIMHRTAQHENMQRSLNLLKQRVWHLTTQHENMQQRLSDLELAADARQDGKNPQGNV